ncbi:MAG: hypothetical protein V2B19_18910 [Pseudomonadota bacterium]
MMRWWMGVTCLLLSFVQGARATDAGEASLMSRMADGFETHVRLLGFCTTTIPIDGPGNPDNRILNIPRYSATAQARPDLKLDFDRLTVSVQPRVELQWEAWREGPQDGRSRREDATYIHQWLVRGRFLESVYFSCGRENLQWGPAYLTSLSNPFYSDNGRGNPKMEIPAADFVRAVWAPNVAWSVSLITQTGSGRIERVDDTLSGSWALKADYSGASDYGSLIVADGEGDHHHIGGFYGGTLSDALLLYAEGAFEQHRGARYPEFADTPIGLALQPDKDDTWRGAYLAGGSYTLTAGPVLSAEYLYYGPGYDGTAAGRFFELQTSAAQLVRSGGSLLPSGNAALFQTADPGLRFFRQHYLMIQCLKSDIAGAIDLTVRWTQNLDDGSGRFTGIGEWSLGDHFQLFTTGTVNRGSRFTEFGRIFNYQIMIGMEYTL